MLSSTTATTIENTHPKRWGRRFTGAQLNKLEAIFDQNDGYIDLDYKDALAREFDVDESSVRTWFTSRRAKIRRRVRPTTSSFAHTIQPSEIKYYRKMLDLSNLQPEQSVRNTGRCTEHRKKLQSQQNGPPSHPCHKQSHTTEIRKPEADSFVAVCLDGRSENTCKGSASDADFTGLLGKAKQKVSNPISVEASYTGIGDKQVYNIQKFSPTALPRVHPVKENPRNHYDGSHVKKTGTPHLPHERPSTKLRGILPKSAMSPSPSERQGQGHLLERHCQPQDGDGCSNVLSSSEQIKSLSENSGMCLPHVPMSTHVQLPSKSVVVRGQETLVPDKDTLVHQGLPGEITVEPKEHEHLNNYSRQGLSSVERSLYTDCPNIQHPALNRVSFFSAMCEIDTDWTPLPDDVAVMFNSYRESPDCSGGVDITDAA